MHSPYEYVKSNGCNNLNVQKAADLEQLSRWSCGEYKALSSQPAECINKLRSLFYQLIVVSVGPALRTLLMLFVGESNDVVLDALLLQLLQLFRCSFSVDSLGLCHGCICNSCDSRVSSSSLQIFRIHDLLL